MALPIERKAHLKETKETLLGKTNEQLYSILYVHSMIYTREAIQATKEEFARRQLDAQDMARKLTAADRALVGKAVYDATKVPTGRVKGTAGSGDGGIRMALRFQGSNEDEVDRQAKREGYTPVLIFIFVLLAAIDGVTSWFSNKSLASYEQGLGLMSILVLAYWFAAPFYYEFRIRTKEIDGKVSAIEGAVAASQRESAQLRSELSAVRDKLGDLYEMRMQLQSIHNQINELSHKQ
jgi:hypothetical protein